MGLIGLESSSLLTQVWATDLRELVVRHEGLAAEQRPQAQGGTQGYPQSEQEHCITGPGPAAVEHIEHPPQRPPGGRHRNYLQEGDSLY